MEDGAFWAAAIRFARSCVLIRPVFSGGGRRRGLDFSRIPAGTSAAGTSRLGSWATSVASGLGIGSASAGPALPGSCRGSIVAGETAWGGDATEPVGSTVVSPSFLRFPFGDDEPDRAGDEHYRHQDGEFDSRGIAACRERWVR